jgi:signal transduction histidine kinase/FixJ family two-component response regulator
MTAYSLLQAAAIGGQLFVLGLVYGRWRLTPVHRALLLFLWAGLGWALLTFFLALPASEGHELLAKRIAAVCWIPLNFWILRFTYILLKKRRDFPLLVLGALTTLSLAIYLGTDLAITGFERHDWGTAAIRGPLHLPISLLSAACALLALGHLALGWRHAPTAAQRRPLAVITIGCALALVAAFSANLILPVFVRMHGFPEIGSYAVFIISPFLYFAVVRYDFLQIDVPHVARELFETAKDGILLVDQTGMVRQANRAAQDLLSTEPRGLSLDQILPAVRQRRGDCEQFIVGEGDDERFIELSRNPEVEHHAGEVVILRDVTTERRAEAVLRESRDELSRQVQQRTEELDQAQKMEAIGTIAGGFAHDFNNILAAIIGFATAGKSDLPEDHPVQADLDDILLASNRGRSIVRQLMSFTRRRSTHRAIVDGTSCVAEAVRLLGASTPPNITVQLEEIRSHAVRADPAQLTQVLLNLAANSFQAMAKRGGTLRLEVDVVQRTSEEPIGGQDRLPPGEYVQITVSDDGPGMRAEVAQHAFEPFFTTKSADEGTGLGLATAHRIIKEHGGAIVLETSPGEGCSLRLLLPCVEGDTHKETEEKDAVPTGTERVFLVDDAEQVVRAVSRMLEPLGYRVRSFTDPEEALREFRARPKDVDLVITDLAMPRLNGSQLAQALLELRPDLPILIVTGHATPRDGGLSARIPIRSVLFKPLDRTTLAMAVRQQLDVTARQSWIVDGQARSSPTVTRQADSES